MQYIFKFGFLLLFALSACTSVETEKKDMPSDVKIIRQADKYVLQVNGEPFRIKGVGMGYAPSSKYKALETAGGNAFRTWQSDKLAAELDTASRHHLMIAAGIPLGQELHGFDYNDEAAVEAQFEQAKKIIDTYKNHPNILCWVAGNELNLLFDENGGLKLVNPKTYTALARIVDYIHENDPHHPVGTTFAGVMKEHIDLALANCPNLDFLGLQVYGALAVLPQEVQKAGINKPFMVTEFGPVGHWEMPATAWGREIEECSAPKAAGMASRIQTGIEGDKSGLNIGNFAFLWGQKQERTPTWYGMFNKSGEATARVDELTKYWTGSYPANRAPLTDSIKLDNQTAFQSIYLKPNMPYQAQVFVRDLEGDSLTYKWVILKEVDERSEGGAFEKEPEDLAFEVKMDSNGELLFVSPTETGDYRLFAYIYDGKGKVGNANVPFFVKE